MSRQAKLIITSEDKSKAGIQSAIKNILGIDDAAKKIGTALTAAFSVTAIIAAGKKLAEFGADCVETFGGVERSTTQLKTALGGNEASFQRLSGFIGQMASKTLASKDEVEHLVDELASLGKSDSDIERITQASVALSNVTGDSLNAAFTEINATFSGTGGKLEKLVPEIGGLSKAQLEAGDAVDLLNKKFGAISDSMSSGISQQLSNMKKSFEEFREAIGENLAPLFSPVIQWISEIADKWTDSLRNFTAYQEGVKKGLENLSLEKQSQSLAYQISDAKNAQDLKMRQAGYTGADSRKSDYLSILESLPEHKKLLELQTQLQTVEAKIIANQKAAEENPRQGSSPLGASSAPEEGMGLLTPAEIGNAFGWTLNSMVPGLEKLFPDPVEMADSFGSAAASSIGSMFAPFERAVSVFKDAVHSQLVGKKNDNGSFSGGTEIGNTLSDVSSSASGLDNLDSIFTNLGSVVSGGLGSLAVMFFQLESIQALFNPLQTIFESMMDVLGPLINQALAPIVGCLKIVGKILAATLVPVLNILTPVINLLAQVFIWFMNKVMIPVGNFIIDIWNGIAGALNAALGWLGVNIAYAAHIAGVSMDDAIAAGQTSYSSSSSGSSASYTGAQAITFNFYNQGNVVGSGGLEELAMLIDSIIKRNERYA